MSAFNEENVLSVHHWTDKLFTFTTTRDPALRFSNGHFTMIGLRVNNKPLLRAYSIVSPNYEEHLEFLSIKVPNGPLTSRLQHVQPGDTIVVGAEGGEAAPPLAREPPAEELVGHAGLGDLGGELDLRVRGVVGRRRRERIGGLDPSHLPAG